MRLKARERPALSSSLAAARPRHGIGLVGPGRPNVSWQSRSGAKQRGLGNTIHVQFRAADCRACPSRARCTWARSKCQGRVLAVMPWPEHEALAAATAREGTLSQAVRAFGLHQAHYRGLANAALNLDRIAAWFAGCPLAPTRTTRRLAGHFANSVRSLTKWYRLPVKVSHRWGVTQRLAALPAHNEPAACRRDGRKRR